MSVNVNDGHCLLLGQRETGRSMILGVLIDSKGNGVSGLLYSRERCCCCCCS